MNVFSPVMWLIAARSLLQHRIFTSVLGLAIALVTANLIAITGISEGMRKTLLVSATTMVSGHVNVSGFFKSTASQSAPVVTGYKQLREKVRAEVPELDYIVQRGRGWAKLISDTSSLQVGIGGIDVANEPGFRQVVILKDGNLDGLAKPDGLLLFEEQATKLGVKVGDSLTFSAPTFRGTNNTLDVTVVAIAANIGMLSSWNVFLNDEGLRRLYQLNDETTGALMLYLKDIEVVPQVMSRLRTTLSQKGYQLMDANPEPFFRKFDAVNRESWTGQKLDVTSWEDETSFVKWFITLFSLLASIVTFLLVSVIGVGIMNVMWITIRERTREIGTLRAVGMQRSSVLQMFVTEGFLLGLIGTVLGALLGVGISLLVNNSRILLPKGMQFIFLSERLVVTPTPFWVVFAVVFITGTITLVSIIPSFRAARLKPVSAMSHVG
jgi:putative ABC transport system permease protein